MHHAESNKTQGPGHVTGKGKGHQMNSIYINNVYQRVGVVNTSEKWRKWQGRCAWLHSDSCLAKTSLKCFLLQVEPTFCLNTKIGVSSLITYSSLDWTLCKGDPKIFHSCFFCYLNRPPFDIPQCLPRRTGNGQILNLYIIMWMYIHIKCLIKTLQHFLVCKKIL